MQNIRNFSIISHVDHGKSTLADRFLELTGTIEKRNMHERYLDMHPLEKERGITIKLQPVRMKYTQDNESYILNLIDTPGHVDFSYEVSRSLAAVEGAILLVDAIKGVQAQTIANLRLAQEQKVIIIPVINKIDLPNARIEEIEKEMSNLLEIDIADILKISAKTGTNVEDILKKIISTIPPPKGTISKPFKALIFDSEFNTYKGVIAYVRVFDGQLRSGEKIKLYATNAIGDVVELGYFLPKLAKQKIISAGDIGYIATGLKEPKLIRSGDTIFKSGDKEKITPMPGYKEPLPVVFASFYPEDASQLEELRDALDKLHLIDSSFFFEPESSAALGRGFRVGFLGMLHIEIVSERLRREFGLNLIVTSPAVEYNVFLKNKKKVLIRSAFELTEKLQIEKIEEPVSQVNIITPIKYMGDIMDLLHKSRGVHMRTDYLSTTVVQLIYKVPLAEIITDFYDQLKGVSSGYASMGYKSTEPQISDLVRLNILIAGDIVEPFSRIVPRSRAYSIGKSMVEKLKNVIPKQLFEVSLQAALGGKIIARETIRALRKDVTGYLYGGDVTRKMKLLKKQKKGKKKMKKMGKVNIPHEVFLEMLKK